MRDFEKERLIMIQNIRLEMFGIKKEGFPIPSPSSDEDEQKYISRCISEIVDEYPEDGQAYAICKGKWDE
jgi:hypothetical protein